MAYGLQGSAQIACAVDAATAITNGEGRSSAKLAGVCVTPRYDAPAAGQTAALASRIQTDNPIAALSVPRGREEACARRIRAAAGSSASEVFVLARECARSHAGAWELVREPAYPAACLLPFATPRLSSSASTPPRSPRSASISSQPNQRSARPSRVSCLNGKPTSCAASATRVM